MSGRHVRRDGLTSLPANTGRSASPSRSVVVPPGPCGTSSLSRLGLRRLSHCIRDCGFEGQRRSRGVALAPRCASGGYCRHLSLASSRPRPRRADVPRSCLATVTASSARTVRNTDQAVLDLGLGRFTAGYHIELRLQQAVSSRLLHRCTGSSIPSEPVRSSMSSSRWSAAVCEVLADLFESVPSDVGPCRLTPCRTPARAAGGGAPLGPMPTRCGRPARPALLAPRDGSREARAVARALQVQRARRAGVQRPRGGPRPAPPGERLRLHQPEHRQALEGGQADSAVPRAGVRGVRTPPPGPRVAPAAAHVRLGPRRRRSEAPRGRAAHEAQDEGTTRL